MSRLPFLVLRIGLGIVFVLIGIMIWQAPELWGSFMSPWMVELLPLPLVTFMKIVGVVDIAIGVLLIVNVLTWLIALVAALHLLGIIITLGYNDIAVRDFGLMAAALAIILEARQRGGKRVDAVGIQG